MHRRLVLMRHAKSDWSTDAPDDHSRPLNARGQRDAPRMARWLLGQGWRPDAAVCSDARRTLETWERMVAVLQGGPRQTPPLVVEPSLYLASLGELQRVAARWPDAWGTVLALGHNPGWEHALGVLCGQDLAMTTANCALLQGAGDTWQEALEHPWELVAVGRPRELREVP